MKRSYFLILIITLLTQISALFGQTKGNGNVVTQERNVSSFHAIEVNGAVEIFLEQGSSQSVAVKTDENLQEVVKTEVKNGVLIVDNTEGIRHQTEMKLFLKVKNLDRIELNGATELFCEGTLKVETLRIEISGAAKIDLNIKATDIEAQISGAGNVNFEGKANSLTTEITGAGAIHAFDLEADDITLMVSGAGSARVHAHKTLNVDISGVAKVIYTGSPKISKQISGMAVLSSK